jgi:hypothetical protein
VPVGGVFVPGSWAYESNQGCCDCGVDASPCCDEAPNSLCFAMTTGGTMDLPASVQVNWYSSRPAWAFSTDPAEENPGWFSDIFEGCDGTDCYVALVCTGSEWKAFLNADGLTSTYAVIALIDVTCSPFDTGLISDAWAPPTECCDTSIHVRVYASDDCDSELPPDPPPGCPCDEADEFEVIVAGVTCSGGAGSPDGTYALLFDADCAWTGTVGDWTVTYLPDSGILLFDYSGAVTPVPVGAAYAGPVGCGGTFSKYNDGSGCTDWPATLTVTLE